MTGSGFKVAAVLIYTVCGSAIAFSQDTMVGTAESSGFTLSSGNEAANGLVNRSPFDSERRAFVLVEDRSSTETTGTIGAQAPPRFLGFGERSGMRVAILEDRQDGEVYLLGVGDVSPLGQLVAMSDEGVELMSSSEVIFLSLYGDG